MSAVPLILVVGGDALAVRVCEELCATQGHRVALVVWPALSVGLATVVSLRWGGGGANRRESATRFSYALVPLGFGMWLAHYSYHLFPAATSFIPVIQRLALDMGIPFLGEPDWKCACCIAGGTGLLKLELLFLELGLLATLYLTHRIDGELRPTLRDALKAWIPWAALALVLEGYKRGEAGKLCGMDRQTLRDRVPG